ncbi:unnamed protein product, partial [marine sediment metagenome]
TPTQDIVLGIAYLTRAAPGAKGEGKVFVRECDAVLAYESGAVDVHAPVKLYVGGELVDTTVGRIIFHDSLPPEVALSRVNNEMNGDDLRDLVAWAFKHLGHDKMVELLDDLKNVGFKYASLAGISIAMDDMHIPDEKQELIELAREQVG